jgi:hypothetical protein
MQRCPKCGYREGVDWPALLQVIAFCVLYLVWMLGDYGPRELRGLGLATMILFCVGTIWRVLRLKSFKAEIVKGSIPKAPSQ